MKKVSTFIFVHDQDIILDFIEKNRFKDLEDFTYVLLSNRPTDKITHLNNVIIAKDFQNNIEQYPKFTSFTGWYILWKYDLIKTEYVNLFEYDINYHSEFNTILDDLLLNSPDFVGYFPMSLKDPVYIQMGQYSLPLIESIKKKTGVNVNFLIINQILKDNNSIWSSSSNSTWKTEKFYSYMEWMNNFIDDIKDDNFCGHMHERSLSMFYYIHNLNVIMTNGLMSHFQLNTHGTSPLPPDRFKKLYNNLK